VELRDVGEFGLIDRIERAVRRAGRARGVVLGIGDDAALLRLRAGEDVAVPPTHSSRMCISVSPVKRRARSAVALSRRRSRTSQQWARDHSVSSPRWRRRPRFPSPTPKAS
jgi:hypothetical protein